MEACLVTIVANASLYRLRRRGKGEENHGTEMSRCWLLTAEATRCAELQGIYTEHLSQRVEGRGRARSFEERANGGYFFETRFSEVLKSETMSSK